jgi:mono/diheme cytochrome c family protein
MRYFWGTFLLVIIGTLSILGLRGTKSTKPPLYIFPDMDYQAKYLPQGENTFFKDGRNDRSTVPGVIARGQGTEAVTVFSREYTYLPADHPEIYTGKNEKGEWVSGFPLPVTYAFVQKGKEKYTIFCKVCHGAIGDGNGITKQYGIAATPTYHDERLRTMHEGEIFNTITHGKNTMYPYGDKLDPEERWAIIAYVRCLQRAQNASAKDVPPSIKLPE